MATKVDFVPFENLFTVPLRNGLTRPKAVRGKGVKMINMGELFAHPRINNVKTDRVPFSGNENSFLLKSGDLLFARQSLVLAGAGKCSIFVGDDEEVTYEGHIIRARINSEIADPFFYYYFFNSPVGRQVIESIVEQVAAAGIRGSDLAKLNVPYLPPPEQRAIAGILGSLDDKIEGNRRMNATLESMARAMFRHWFLENEEVGKWEVGKTKDLCLRVENGGTPRRDKPEFWEPGTIPWLTSGEVRQNIITLTENKISESGYQNSSAKLWPSDTTVVALYGATAGEVSFIAQELCANQACCGLIPKPDTKYFLYLTLSSSAENLSLQARGSAQQNLSQQIVADFPVIIPDNKSLENFNNIVESMFEKWILNLKESRALASLRDGLLPKLMRGKVKVKDI